MLLDLIFLFHGKFFTFSFKMIPDLIFLHNFSHLINQLNASVALI